MKITERVVGDVIILDLQGKMTLGEGDHLLKEKIDSLIAQGKTKIILNQANKSYMDSAGLGEVARSWMQLQRNGGELKLLNLGESTELLLQCTRLDQVFEIFVDEDEAIQSFAPKPSIKSR